MLVGVYRARVLECVGPQDSRPHTRARTGGRALYSGNAPQRRISLAMGPYGPRRQESRVPSHSVGACVLWINVQVFFGGSHEVFHLGQESRLRGCGMSRSVPPQPVCIASVRVSIPTKCHSESFRRSPRSRSQTPNWTLGTHAKLPKSNSRPLVSGSACTPKGRKKNIKRRSWLCG